MGQQLSSERRRLTEADESREQIEQRIEARGSFPYTFKPFGGWNYGYTEMYQVLASWTIWAAVTYSSVKIDMYEGIGVTAASLLINEKGWGVTDLPVGNGSSYAHNIQAGYCWYHYYIRNNPAGFWGSWAEVAGNLGAIGQELLEDSDLYSHAAHYRGASIGMTLAFLLDMMRRGRLPKLARWGMFPVAVIIAMYAKDHKERIS